MCERAGGFMAVHRLSCFGRQTVRFVAGLAMDVELKVEVVLVAAWRWRMIGAERALGLAGLGLRGRMLSLPAPMAIGRVLGAA